MGFLIFQENYFNIKYNTGNTLYMKRKIKHLPHSHPSPSNYRKNGIILMADARTR